MHNINRSVASLAAAIMISACAGGNKSSDPGAAAPAAPASMPANPADTLPSSVTPAMTAQGRALFNDGSCAKCHGLNGINGQYGPNLPDNRWVQIQGTYAEIVNIIVTGVPGTKQKLASSNPQFAMRPRGGMNYSNEDIAKIAAYVWTASHTAKR
jgi:mono/diheme cytochrome c family protein